MVFCVFIDQAPTAISTYFHTLSLHDALPIWAIRTDAGQAVSNSGRFGVRLEGAETCVTCLAGRVKIVTAAAANAALGPGEQLTFASGSLGKVVSVDPEKAEAWRSGLLLFTDEPISQVVDEINRYRPGTIGRAAWRERG